MIAQEWMTNAILLVFNITICTNFSSYIEIVIFEDLFIINSILVKFHIVLGLFVFIRYRKGGDRGSTFRNICDMFWFCWIILDKKEFQIHFGNFRDWLYAFCKCTNIFRSLQNTTVVYQITCIGKSIKPFKMPLQILLGLHAQKRVLLPLIVHTHKVIVK